MTRNESLDYRNYTFSYFPGNTFFHRLNPVSKLIFIILLTIMTFIIKSLILLALILCLIIAITLLSGISMKRLIKKTRYIVLVLVLSVILNIFFNAIPNEQEIILFYLFNLQFLPIRRLAVYFSLRALLIVLTLYSSTIIYTNTTSPKTFVYSLIKLHIPYKYCFAFMVGLKYIPSIEHEAKTIALAQKARGLSRKNASNIKKVYRLIFERLLSTMVSILRKGHTTSISMENRCFGLYKERSNLITVKFTLLDFVFLIFVFIIFISGMLYIFNFFPIPEIPSLYNLIFR